MNNQSGENSKKITVRICAFLILFELENEKKLSIKSNVFHAMK